MQKAASLLVAISPNWFFPPHIFSFVIKEKKVKVYRFMFMLQSAQEPKGVSKLLLLKAYVLLIF